MLLDIGGRLRLSNDRSKRTENGEVVHSFGTIMRELGTNSQHTGRINGTEATFTDVTKPTPIQQRALALVSELPLAL